MNFAYNPSLQAERASLRASPKQAQGGTMNKNGMTFKQHLWYRQFVIRMGYKRIWTERLPLWLARHMPKRVLYWAVVWAASKTKGNPAEVSAIEMLDFIYPPENARA